MSRYTLELSNQVLNDLDAIAQHQQIARVDVVRKAFALIKVAFDETQKGNDIVVVNESESNLTIVSKLYGI